MDSWQFYLMWIFICLVIQGFFAMVELACVSFNKVRLQYYVAHKKRRAIWLNYLIHHPAFLFGTTLIGVNTALVVGSECSRRFYESLGMSPDWAPLSQIVIVLIFAEIAPMLAGRQYAERVAMFGVPLLMGFSLLLRPIIWTLDGVCRLVARLCGTPVAAGSYLSREELQNILSEREEAFVDRKEFDTVVSHIFSLRSKTAKDLMEPLAQVTLLPSFSTVGEMRQIALEKHVPFIPIYHRNTHHIVAIAYPRDLLRLSENKKIRDYARSPWFLPENMPILEILKQFRRNNQSVAIVLNETGLAMGILTLDEIVDELFDRSDAWMSFDEMVPRAYHVVVDRTFPADMLVSTFNEQFHVHLVDPEELTLEDLMIQRLGHPPSKGESVRIDQFELTVEEASLLGAKMIHIRTVF